MRMTLIRPNPAWTPWVHLDMWIQTFQSLLFFYIPNVPNFWFVNLVIAFSCSSHRICCTLSQWLSLTLSVDVVSWCHSTLHAGWYSPESLGFCRAELLPASSLSWAFKSIYFLYTLLRILPLSFKDLLYVFIVCMYVSYEHIFHMAFCSSGPNWTIKKEYFKLFHRTVFLWSWPVPSGSNISLPSASPFTHNICVTVPCFGISIQYPAPVCFTLRDLCTNPLYIFQGSLNPKPG